jgi:hypothetical protein
MTNSICDFDYLYGCLNKIIHHVQNKLAVDQICHYPLLQKTIQKTTLAINIFTDMFLNVLMFCDVSPKMTCYICPLL